MQFIRDPAFRITVPTAAEIQSIAAASNINASVNRPFVDMFARQPLLTFRRGREDYASLNLVTFDVRLSRQATADRATIVVPQAIKDRLLANRTTAA